MSSTLDAADAAPPLGRPRSRTDLFITFTLMALQGFGGVLAVVQRELVERKRWMSREEFVEEWAVAQIMPGPNVINLGITFGSRWFGFSGAAVAVAGLTFVPLLVVLVLGVVYSEFASNPHMAGALRGMGAVAAGLITATGLKLLPALKRNTLGVPVCTALGAASFIAIAVLKLPLLGVLLVVGGLGCVLAFRKLAA
jgi:chromate transporter